MVLAPFSPGISTPGDVDGIYSRREILLLVGPVLFGSLINWLLLGVLTMQTYICYLCFPRDHWWIKFSAYGLYLLELGQTVLVTDNAWAILCAGWGMPIALVQNGWGVSMTPLLSGLIACWVQIFFAWRVWTLGHNTFWKSVTVVIIVISFAQGCVAVALGVKLNAVMYLNIDSGLVEIRHMFFFYSTGSAITNFLIAASMLYFTISTRMCSAVAFLDLAIYLRDGQNTVHISILMVLSKLYSNALIASLNSRAVINGWSTMSDSREGGHSTSGLFNTAQFTSIGVPVTTGEIEWVDGRGVQSSESNKAQEYVKSGHAVRCSASIALTNLSSV